MDEIYSYQIDLILRKLDIIIGILFLIIIYISLIWLLEVVT